MIEVRVREKHHVDFGQLVEFESWRGQPFRTDGKSRQSNPDTRKEHRVGENFDAEEIDEDRSVADPGRRYLGIVPFQRLWFGESGGDGAPTFDSPFTPKVAHPMAHPPTAKSWLL